MRAQRIAMKQHVTRMNEFGSIWDPNDPQASHERFGNLWVSWLCWMMALEDAELHLAQQASYTKGKHGEIFMPFLYGIRAMLLGYALECGLKALWLRQGNKLVVNGKYRGVAGANDHDLVQLVRATKFCCTAREIDVLARLSNFVRFAGRYPVAKTSNDMQPDVLTRSDVGFFSKGDFRVAESLYNKIQTAITGKRRGFPRRPRSLRWLKYGIMPVRR
jgi:hypothetical protein